MSATSGVKAFGRPRKRRYRNSFYVKQQIRHFYGKIKEESFSNFYQNYRNTLKTSTNSFSAILESRLEA